MQSRKRRKLHHYVPEDLISDGCVEQEAIDFAQLKKEFAVINAELEIARLNSQNFIRCDANGICLSCLARMLLTSRRRCESCRVGPRARSKVL